MDIQLLSKSYTVKRIEEADIPDVYHLCKGNPKYYFHCPPAATLESVREELIALPPNKTPEDKYYLGFYDGRRLIAVMDIIDGYPTQDIAWIGFFMMEAEFQGAGTGTKIVEEACSYLQQMFSCVRLGYVDGNEQSEHFWLKNHFYKTGQVSKKELYDVIVMQRDFTVF